MNPGKEARLRLACLPAIALAQALPDVRQAGRQAGLSAMLCNARQAGS
jgi:hypothetical protein